MGRGSIRVATFVAVLCVVTIGCVTDEMGDDTEFPDEMPPGTRVVSVQVLDAVISPGKATKDAWDGFGTVPDSVWSGLAAALGAPAPAGAVIAFLGGQAVAALEKPDPFGTASIHSQSVANSGVEISLATTSNNLEDTLLPSWPTPPRWDNVPLTSDLRVRITLLDEDLSNHDPIGVVELNASDLDAAARANQLYEVRVDDQSNGQLLFVGVSVRQTGTL